MSERDELEKAAEEYADEQIAKIYGDYKPTTGVEAGMLEQHRISYSAVWLKGALFGAEQERKRCAGIITPIQLAVANAKKLRPDIKQGHWIACHDIAKAIRESGEA